MFLSNDRLYKLFFMQVFGSLIGYLATWTACKMNLQKVCFVFPYLLATPVAVVVMTRKVGFCDMLFDAATCDTEDEIGNLILYRFIRARTSYYY